MASKGVCDFFSFLISAVSGLPEGSRLLCSCQQLRDEKAGGSIICGTPSLPSLKFRNSWVLLKLSAVKAGV